MLLHTYRQLLMYVLKLGMPWHSLNKSRSSTHLHVIVTWISNPSLDFSTGMQQNFYHTCIVVT